MASVSELQSDNARQRAAGKRMACLLVSCVHGHAEEDADSPCAMPCRIVLAFFLLVQFVADATIFWCASQKTMHPSFCHEIPDAPPQAPSLLRGQGAVRSLPLAPQGQRGTLALWKPHRTDAAVPRGQHRQELVRVENKGDGLLCRPSATGKEPCHVQLVEPVGADESLHRTGGSSSLCGSPFVNYSSRLLQSSDSATSRTTTTASHKRE